MNAEDLLKQGKLDEALAALQEQVKAKPAEHKLRVFLFQLLAVMGRWDRALTQLNVASEMNPESLLLAQLVRPALACEAFRAQVFAGKRTPLVVGEPDEWVGWMIQAAQFDALGQHDQGAALREKALAAAPAVPGKLQRHAEKDPAPDAPGEPLEWIADADSRLGPMLEIIMDGRYYWCPMHRLIRVDIDKPVDLRDAVWLCAMFTFTSGGTKPGLIPTRYPGTESSKDGTLRLARKTEWVEKAPGFFCGLGARVLTTDNGEYGLTEVRRIMLNHS
jgi:type VI secretion system protein ImpE